MTFKNDPNSPAPQNDPRDDIAAFSIGAADRDESLAVQRLLAERPEHRREAAEYAAAATALNASVPRREPPAALKAKIMATARATQPAAPTLSTLPKPVEQRARSSARSVVTWLATAAAVVLLGLNVFWMTQVNTLRAEQEAAATASADLNTVVALLTADDSQRVELMGDDGAKRAMVVWTPTHSEGFIMTDALPALGSGQTYQLWAISTEGTPMSAGVFDSDEDGVVSMLFESPLAWDAIDAFGISVEPEGGSELPTTTPLAVGAM